MSDPRDLNFKHDCLAQASKYRDEGNFLMEHAFLSCAADVEEWMLAAEMVADGGKG